MRPLVLAGLMLAFVSLAMAPSYGVAPPIEDHGTVERGSSITGQIFISSDVTEPFSVEPVVSAAMPSSIYDANNERIVEEEYSDQNITGWFDFGGTSRIYPSRYTPPEGVPDDIDGVVEYTLRIPQDADPGYHSAQIDIRPSAELEDFGTGTNVRAVSRQEVYFRVEGGANRNIGVQGVRSFRTGQDEVRIDVLFRNTGTVTLEVPESTIEIRDNAGNLVNSLNTGGFTIEAGERRYVTETWEGGDVAAGTYQLSVSANYRTGTAFGSESISVSEAVEIVPSEARNPNEQFEEQDGQSDSVPFWLVALGLVLTGILLYSFDIDPVWILVVVGGLGIVSFILMSGVPNTMILALALVAAAAYYIL